MKKIFHTVSYLQYPLMLVGVYYSLRPYMNGFNSIWEDFGNVLLFMGLGISFSTLQDTTKTQNKISLRVWENAAYGKRMILGTSFVTLFFILIGVYGFFFFKNTIPKEFSIGVIAFGISMIGLIKAMLEMAENHRKN